MYKRLTLLFVFFFTTGFGKVDIVLPEKTIKVHVFLFMMCGQKVAYIINHRGRSKVISINGMNQSTAKMLNKYKAKYPIKGTIRILPGHELPCNEEKQVYL